MAAKKKAAKPKAETPANTGTVQVRALKSFASFVPGLPGSCVAGRVYDVSPEVAASLGRLVEVVEPDAE